MGWPQSQDYNEAIQSPKVCFSNPELSKGEVVANPLGIPLPCSGNFADVYQVRCPHNDTRWAVKCFTRGDPVALQQRYAQIGDHLQQARLAFTVGFRFLEEGIRPWAVFMVQRGLPQEVQGNGGAGRVSQRVPLSG